MKANTDRRYGGWSRLCRILALCLALMFLVPAVQTPFGGGSDARAESRKLELELIQTQPEEGFLMIPGAPMPQDITVRLGETSGPCYVYVQVREENNENDYLIYQMADGWQQLQDAEGASVSGVYYRLYDQQAAVSWPVLANQEIMVNPETMTWPVMEQLAADTSGASWPFLGYTAYGIELEDADGAMTPYDGWYILNSNQWRVVVDPRNPDAGMGNALGLAEGLSLDAFDVSLQDANGNHMQPQSPVQVKLPVADGADSAVVLHVLDTHARIVQAINKGSAGGLQTGANESVIFEQIEVTVQDGYAVFETDAFSPYYVVSGHGETLENWWETTQVKRYNFDSEVYGLDADQSGSREFRVEPDATFYLYLEGDVTVNGQTQNGPVSGSWNISSDTSGGRIMLTTAGDGIGRVVRVSADAQSGDQLVFTANNWTVTISVAGNIAEDTYNDSNYPVYIGITLDGSTISIGNEPRVSGYDNNAWVYITQMSKTGDSSANITFNGSSGAYEQYKTVAPVEGSVGADYLTEDIKTVQMLQATDNKHVKGIIDNTLDTTANGAIDIDPYIQNIDWAGIKTALLADSSVASQLKATDGVAVSSSNQANYALQPYVVKIQTGNFIGWHINACFVPVSSADGWVYFDENLDESLGQQVEFLNVPARRPWNGGKGTTASMYYVNPKEPGSNYVKVSVSEYVTLTNGQKMRFMGWNTMPDGSGDMYSGEGGVFDSPNEKTEHVLVANGTLYAFWDSTLDRLEIHKDLIIDEDQDASGRHKTDFTFTVNLTLPDGLEIDSNMKIIAEEFYVADGSLVPNTQQSVSLQGNQKNYTITFTFNEDQYGVIYAPKGTTYTVTETLPSGNDYTLIGSQNTSGKIEGVGEGRYVRFTNGWKNTTGMLRVSKQVELAEGQTVENWNTTKFPITVELTAPAGVSNPSYTYRLYNANNLPAADPVTTTENTLTFELAHNESVVFSGIKEGTTFTATETIPADTLFTPAQNPLNGTIKANETQEAVFVNRIVETDGTLTITKAFDGCTPEPGESFVFTVTDASNNIVGEVVIYGAGSKILTLPYGEYTVAEDDSWSWRYEASVSPSLPVEISSATKNPSVTFTNTKDKNNWLDGSAGATNDFGDKTVTKHGGEQ